MGNPQIQPYYWIGGIKQIVGILGMICLDPSARCSSKRSGHRIQAAINSLDCGTSLTQAKSNTVERRQ